MTQGQQQGTVSSTVTNVDRNHNQGSVPRCADPGSQRAQKWPGGFEQEVRPCTDLIPAQRRTSKVSNFKKGLDWVNPSRGDHGKGTRQYAAVGLTSRLARQSYARSAVGFEAPIEL